MPNFNVLLTIYKWAVFDRKLFNRQRVLETPLFDPATPHPKKESTTRFEPSNLNKFHTKFILEAIRGDFDEPRVL